jgi:hypothetical protein
VAIEQPIRAKPRLVEAVLELLDSIVQLRDLKLVSLLLECHRGAPRVHVRVALCTFWIGFLVFLKSLSCGPLIEQQYHHPV